MMRHSFAIRSVLVAATLGTSVPLAAQTAPRLPTNVQTTVKPAVTRATIDKSAVLQSSLPFAQSLQVSADGTHWGSSATVTYTNPCSRGQPSMCGITPPHLPLWLRWNPPAASDHVALASSIGYYLIDVTPVGDQCWDVTKISYIQGDQNMTHWNGSGPGPNASQSYTCTYRIDAQTLFNGTPGHIATNAVTVNVNIVPATQ